MPDGTGQLERKGVSYILFMKLAVIATAILLTLFARGLRPGIVMIILIIPLWLLTEKVIDNTDSISLWKDSTSLWNSTKEGEQFSRLPLVEDINKMKGARRGQKVKQAILEGRLKDQVYYTLKNEYNLSDEEIDILSEDPDRIAQKIDNEKLMEYLRHARDLNDLKKPDGEDDVELFSEDETKDSDDKKPEFEKKMRSAINELEKIHFVEKSR